MLPTCYSDHSFIDLLTPSGLTEAYILCPYSNTALVATDSSDPVEAKYTVMSPFRSETTRSAVNLELMLRLRDQGVEFVSEVDRGVNSKLWRSNEHCFVQFYAGKVPMAWTSAWEADNFPGKMVCVTAICQFYEEATIIPWVTSHVFYRVWDSVWDVQREIMSDITPESREGGASLCVTTSPPHTNCGCCCALHGSASCD